MNHWSIKTIAIDRFKPYPLSDTLLLLSFKKVLDIFCFIGHIKSVGPNPSLVADVGPALTSVS